MESLFHEPEQEYDPRRIPLADRIRPKIIDDVIGQKHLLGENAPLRKFFENGDFPSIIMWGPAGVGKTTLAYLIADASNYNFVRMSAVDAGVKEVREVINHAKAKTSKGRTLLFIDEIHRFNKNQQDALLHAVEKGIITLIGATTENPSFEVNSALLSRCQVYRLYLLNNDEIHDVLVRALNQDELLKGFNIEISDWDFIYSIAGGDARTALNAVEIGLRYAFKPGQDKIILTKEILESSLQQKTAHYDKKGESHYDTISAFIKSLRGSDPDAALFWLAKMIDAGEDPRFIARRMVIFASEDIGNADPMALVIAISVFQAVELIGMPECTINLGQGVTYLASTNKSNASYMGLRNALNIIKGGISVTVPLHLRNAPTKLMKEEGYGEGYRYPHSYEGNFIAEKYFPDEIEPITFYKPGDSGKEKDFKDRLLKLWKERYKD